MARTQVIFLVFCAFSLSLLLNGCRPHKKEMSINITFDTIRVDKMYHLNNDTTKPACNINITFIYPKTWKEGLGLETLQKIFIEKTFHETFSGLTPQETVNYYVSKYIDDFKSIAKNDFPSDEDELEDETGYPYYLTLTNKVLFNKKNILSFTVEQQIYEGGAHGSSSIYGYVVDLGSVTLIDEDSFAGTNYSKGISDLMINKLVEKNQLSKPEELENIGYGSISDIIPNNNFTLDDKGITYYFNEYEIASYFLGITKISIPYEELNIYTVKNSPISDISGN